MSVPAYPAYRESGVAWIGLVPTTWRISRVSAVADVINGFPFDADQFDPEMGLPLVRIRDLNARETAVRFAGEPVSTALITSDDLLIGMDGDFNVGRWLGEGAALLNQRMCCLRGKNLLIRWLEYALPTPLRRINEVTYSTTVKHLSSGQIRGIRIALPPNDEELAAALTFLDRECGKIDGLVAEQERLIALLKEKRQAVISEAVTKGLDPTAPTKPSGMPWLGTIPAHWTLTPLMWLTQPERPIMYGIVLPGPDVGEGIPILKGGNVRPERMNLASMARTTPEIEAPYARARLKAGDLVYSIRGSIGDCEIVPSLLEGANITQDVARVAPASEVNRNWLRYALLSAPVSEELASGSLGAAVRGINIFDLKRAGIPTPPRQEQDAIAAHIDHELLGLASLTTEAERAVALLRERRAALISAAVTGKIDVRGLTPAAEAA